MLVILVKYQDEAEKIPLNSSWHRRRESLIKGVCGVVASRARYWGRPGCILRRIVKDEIRSNVSRSKDLAARCDGFDKLV